MHFPKKHPWVGYIEKGERKITFGVSTTAVPKNTNSRGEVLDDYGKRPRVTRQTTLEEFTTSSEGGACSPGTVKALKEIASYNKGLIDALEERFSEDFENPFVQEMKDVLDFNFMLELGSKLQDDLETYESSLATVKVHEI